MPESKVVAKQRTRYVVLHAAPLASPNSPSTFTQVDEVEASSAATAIQTAVAGMTNPVEGRYVAVPERSFQVVPVSVKIPAPQIVIGGDNGESEEAPQKEAVAQAARQMREELEPEDEAAEDPDAF